MEGLRICIVINPRYEFAAKWIVACVVLHNITLTVGDEWTEIDEDDSLYQVHSTQHPGARKGDCILK